MKVKVPTDAWRFRKEKLLLLGALACEAAALLIRKGILQADPGLVGRLTVAGAVLVLIYLVIDGLQKKVRHYRRVWGLDENEPEKCADDADLSEEDAQPPPGDADQHTIPHSEI